MKTTLTNAEIQQGYKALQEFEDKSLEGDMIWAVVSNLDELEKHVERYQKAHQRHVQDQVVTGEDGEPVYPEGADPKTSDPKFKDKRVLVQDLNGLLSKEVEVDVQTVSKEDMPSSVKPKLIRSIRFMIEDL